PNPFPASPGPAVGVLTISWGRRGLGKIAIGLVCKEKKNRGQSVGLVDTVPSSPQPRFVALQRVWGWGFIPPTPSPVQGAPAARREQQEQPREPRPCCCHQRRSPGSSSPWCHLARAAAQTPWSSARGRARTAARGEKGAVAASETSPG
uniref:Uncharacterized protein n=1 Tax=Anas platyrhynchos TaxID=8839 RepID=A0A8B9SZA2_ANAPL